MVSTQAECVIAVVKAGKVRAMHMLHQPARLVALFIFCLLGACQKPDVPYAATLDRATLMQLPFPGWANEGDSSVQVLDLSATTPKKDKADTTKVRAQLEPIYVVRIDEAHAVLLTAALPVDEDNAPYICHSCSGTIGAYFFDHNSDGWRLSARQDAVADSGVDGNIGDTSIAKLADGHFALTSNWGSCWQGYCGTWLVVVGLQADKASLLDSGIPLSADNSGAYDSCSSLDKPKDARAPPESEEPPHACFDVRGKWKIQGSQLALNFEGHLSKLGADGQLLPTEKIAQQVVYDFAPGLLTLAKGKNPVPGF